MRRTEPSRLLPSSPAASCASSFNRISSRPQKVPSTDETEDGPRQVQLDYGPHPKAAQWRRLFHDRQVAGRVRHMDEITACCDARGEENHLP